MNGAFEDTELSRPVARSRTARVSAKVDPLITYLCRQRPAHSRDASRTRRFEGKLALTGEPRRCRRNSYLADRATAQASAHSHSPERSARSHRQRDGPISQLQRQVPLVEIFISRVDHPNTATKYYNRRTTISRSMILLQLHMTLLSSTYSRCLLSDGPIRAVGVF